MILGFSRFIIFFISFHCTLSFRLLGSQHRKPSSHLFSSDGGEYKRSDLLHVPATLACVFMLSLGLGATSSSVLAGDDSIQSIATSSTATSSKADDKNAIDFKSFKLPYNHENIPVKEFLGKATIVVNMKLDDPQTPTQYPILIELFNKYEKDGLNLLVFPTEQGYFEPDDDEACRAKSKEYYNFGSYPHGVVFDKVDLIGASAHPFYQALTSSLPTPNGYSRITLNYEKFLLNAQGEPIRRYPRKFSAYDMERDIVSALQGEVLSEETPEFSKAWREAKREAMKSEYAFRLNYNYYDSPDSMYKYNPENDR